tara:strand:- start:55 stop:507 length:453 start_codon:yes stop_codon:yes gene_type:complete
MSGPTSAALGALGSDLAFSVSFGIARELLDGAREAQISDEELIAVLLGLSVVFAALPDSFASAYKEVAKRRWLGVKLPTTGSEATSGLLAFVNLLVDIARRISVSICVQLLAANTRARQPQRAIRILSLLAVAIFFLFLERTSSLGQRDR